MLSFVWFSLEATIHKVTSLYEIKELLTQDEVNSSCLFIFDVDSTLIWYDRSGTVRIVEPEETAQFVHTIQTQAKTIACTSSYVGLDKKRNIFHEDKRRDELLKFNIDFAWQWPHSYVFYELEKNYKSQTQIPVFKYGILFTGAFYDRSSKKIPAYSKGMLLSHFLSKQLKTFHIFMIDNKLAKLKSVEQLAKKLSIPFTGFWYGRIKFSF